MKYSGRHLLYLFGVLCSVTGPAAGEPAGVGDVLRRVRMHEFHPVRNGFTEDRTLGKAGVADLNDSDWRVRTLAVRDLVRAGRAEADATQAGLADGNPHVRQVCAMALGILRAQGAVPDLIRLVRQDPEPYVRAQAAVALGQIGDQAALPAVEAVQASDEHRDVQHQCELAGHALRHGHQATAELAAAYAGLDERRFDRVRVGEPAPDFELRDAEGATWRLSEHRGKRPVALIWIFADWCPVCHGEFRDLIALREEFARSDIAVATLECHDDYLARVMVGKEVEPGYWFSRKSLKEEYTGRIWWPHLADKAAAVGVQYGVQPMAFAVHSEFINRPATIIVDREGIVRFAYYGSYWGDRPSIKETLEIVRSETFQFTHPKRLAPAGGVTRP